MSEQVFCKTVAELTNAITETIQSERLFPALLLLYASMDIIASLTRPITQPDTSGPIFKKWIDKYMLPNSNLLCNSGDIWAARCGFLHTLSTQSKLSREGHARQLGYVNRKDGADRMQKRRDPSARDYVFVGLRHYTKCFLDGVFKFAKEVESDPKLQAVVYHHVGKLAVQIQFKFK